MARLEGGVSVVELLSTAFSDGVAGIGLGIP